MFYKNKKTEQYLETIGLQLPKAARYALSNSYDRTSFNKSQVNHIFSIEEPQNNIDDIDKILNSSEAKAEYEKYNNKLDNDILEKMMDEFDEYESYEEYKKASDKLLNERLEKGVGEGRYIKIDNKYYINKDNEIDKDIKKGNDINIERN